jgi:cysteinyl-tRNA synthetase
MILYVFKKDISIKEINYNIYIKEKIKGEGIKMRLYNTLTNKIEDFREIQENKVRIYCCGPTVYDYPHIGNLRTFCAVDFLVRTFEYFNYEVLYVMNITDVDDKIIKNILKQKISLKEYTSKYEKIFFESIEKLNIRKADYYPRATEHINEMIKIIKKLLEKGIAYIAEDGSIYYSISKFKDYGKLSKIRIENLRAGARVNVDEYDKENLVDFALWKAYNENDGDVYWETEIGKGRPGWHIECSAMNRKYLNQPFDIHAGGIDLIFPHHENEIAQSEGAFETPLANYWFHVNHLVVEGQKMSKSLGNIITIKDIDNPLALRLLYLQTHYRNKLNFTFENYNGSKTALNSLLAFSNNVFDIMTYFYFQKNENVSINSNIKQIVDNYIQDFELSLKDDLNTPKAISLLFELMNSINIIINKNPKEINYFDAEYIFNAIKKTDRVFGLKLTEFDEIPQEIKDLMLKRNEFRKNKQYEQADIIRDEILNRGYIVEDTAWGSRVRKKI